jgi:glycosyltransferase involved in cell wall biosynthesis
MNILQVNTIDRRGGAAVMATNLRKGLIAAGHQSPMIVAHKTGADEDVHQLPLGGRREKANRKLKLAGMGYATYQELTADKFFQDADIVNLHNIHQMPHGFFNIRDLPKVAAARPTVWTLHDPWIIYECGGVPEYDMLFRKESRLFLKQKQIAISQAKVILTAPSQWLYDLVRKSYPDKPIKLLRYGIDTKVFQPGDKLAARKKLGIPAKAKVVLFVANEGEDNEPKGTVYLNQAKEKLSKDGVLFISIGSSRQKTYVDDASVMASYYVAADVFALPSLAENSPITIVESLACGTPAVAFKIGGIPGSIDHLKNGYLAEYKNGNDFIAGLRAILGDRALGQSMSKHARTKALKYFSLDKMSKPAVSVVIGTYNRLGFLKQTIETVRSELKDTDHELIVIDGGSDDGTTQWLVQQKDIISIIQHNRGKWRGRPIERQSWGYFMNLGLRAASAKYVCMLSDDCLVIPGAIKNSIKLFDKELKAGKKIGAVAFYWRNWPEQEKYWVGIGWGERMFVNHGLYLREALKKVDYIDADSYFFYHADGDLCLRMADAGYSCIDSPDSYIEHYSDANTEVRASNNERQKQDWAVYEKRWEHLKMPKNDWLEKDFSDPLRTAEKYWHSKKSIKERIFE